MKEMIQGLPWGLIGVGYIGLLVHVLTTLANPADESLASVSDVFLHRGKTVVTAALVVPFLVLMLRDYGQLNGAAAFAAGYMNISIIKKGAETWMNKSKLVGGGE
jgi:hypothetical protein